MSRIGPPSARHETISRPALLDALAGADGSRLILVSAPAGYGKSTLVAEWCTADRTLPFAWVLLDEADDDPAVLWTMVVAAFDSVLDDFDGARLLEASALGRPGPDVPPVALLNALASRSEPAVLVLDDFQVLRNASCVRQVQSFVDRVPPTVRVAVLTRDECSFPLARYRAAGDVLEVRADRLRFTEAETNALVRTIAGVRLHPPDLGELHDRIEGWPAAAYCAALGLREAADPAAFVAAFSGENRLVADYVRDEVLRPLAAETRTFLRRTSVLDTLSAPLCAEVAGLGGEQLLDRLEKENLFLVPLDEDRHRYRYHHLFRDVLRKDLLGGEPGMAATLRRRAADWHAERGMYEQAVHYALAGEDAEHAGGLLSRHWLGLFGGGPAPAAITDWLASIGGSRTAASPSLAICAAWAAATTGDRAGMEVWLQAAQAVGHDGPLPDGSPSVRFSVSLTRALWSSASVPEILEAAETATALAPDPRSPWGGLAALALGYGRYLAGDHEGALAPLQDAAQSASIPPLFRTVALARLSLALGELDRTGHAAELAASAGRLVEQHGLTGTPLVTPAYTAMGASLAHAGRGEEARTLLRRTLTMRRSCVGLPSWPTVDLLLVLARTTLDLGDRAEAAGLLREAHGVLAAGADQETRFHRSLACLEDGLASSHLPGVVPEPLTAREAAVLRMLRSDLSLREIGRQLYVSPNTVKTHTRAIYRKLGASSRQEALRRAREAGLL